MEAINALGIDLKKEKSAKLTSDITKITNGELTIEEVVAKAKSDLELLIEKNMKNNIQTRQFSKNDVQGGKAIGKYSGEDVVKRKTKFGNVYSNSSNSIVFFEKTKVFGTEIKFTEKQVKELIAGKDVELTLYSTKKEKDYNALVCLDGTNEKGYPNFKLNGFPNKKNEKK